MPASALANGWFSCVLFACPRGVVGGLRRAFGLWDGTGMGYDGGMRRGMGWDGMGWNTYMDHGACRQAGWGLLACGPGGGGSLINPPGT